MATKQVVFTFPAEAWAGIVMALTQWSYQPFVSNPEAANDPTKPPMIPNPKPRDEAALEEVMNIISQRFDAWAMQERMRALEEQNRKEVSQILEGVKQATQIEIK